MTVLQTAAQENEGREPFLRRAGNVGFGLALIVVTLLACGLFLFGMVWVSEKALPWLMYACQVTFAICGFVFLPLCIFTKSRRWAGLGFVIASYVFGVGLLAYSCVVAFQMSGYGGLSVGLFLAGIGVVAIALLDALYAAARHRTQLGLSRDILAMIIITFGTRFLGSCLMTGSTANSESEGTYPTMPDNLSPSPPPLLRHTSASAFWWSALKRQLTRCVPIAYALVAMMPSDVTPLGTENGRCGT